MRKPSRSKLWLAATGLILAATFGSTLAATTTGLKSNQAEAPGIPFSGQEFALYRTEPITNGWAAYYTVGAADPDSVEDEIIINHMNARDERGRMLLPGEVARAMLDQVQTRGGVSISPFSVPDTTRLGDNYTFYATYYYVYAEHDLGDIWLSHSFSEIMALLAFFTGTRLRVAPVPLSRQISATGLGRPACLRQQFERTHRTRQAERAVYPIALKTRRRPRPLTVIHMRPHYGILTSL